MMKMTHHELSQHLTTEKAKAEQAIQNLIDRYDYASQGGAPLLGVDGICIICHGSSGEKAIKNALNMAARYAMVGLNQHIVQELESMPTLAAVGEED
jgi:phosphate acyltransferase